MTPWTNQYIGIPFCADGRDRSGLDCGGLVILVYREQLGVELPDYAGTLIGGMMDLKRARASIMGELGQWEKVERPKAFDVVAFRRGRIDGCHVGIVCGRGRFIHITAGIDVSVASFNDLQWQSKVSGFFRHAAV